MYKKLFYSAAFFLLLTINSFGDVEFIMDYMSTDPQTSSLTKGSVKGKLVRMDYLTNGTEVDSSMIYRGDKDEMIMIDHAEKRYFVMDKKTMQQLSQQISQAMAQLEEAMKDMTEEQKEQMKKMMKERMPVMDGDAEYVEPVFKKVGSDKVNGYSCTIYDVYKGKELYRTHCVTKWGNIEGGDEISGAMMNMADFIDQMTKAFSQNSQIKFEKNIFYHLKKMDGFPVQTKDFYDGKIEGQTNFKSSKQTTLNNKLFDAPPGYIQEKMG